jgi:hypothetical protein
MGCGCKNKKKEEAAKVEEPVVASEVKVEEPKDESKSGGIVVSE